MKKTKRTGKNANLIHGTVASCMDEDKNHVKGPRNGSAPRTGKTNERMY